MVDLENHIHQSLSQQIRKAFGNAVFNTVIELDGLLRESPLYAQPITTFATDSLGADQYRHLAQELLPYIRETRGRAE
jgi:chromosome partitioning protein